MQNTEVELVQNAIQHVHQVTTQMEVPTADQDPLTLALAQCQAEHVRAFRPQHTAQLEERASLQVEVEEEEHILLLLQFQLKHHVFLIVVIVFVAVPMEKIVATVQVTVVVGGLNAGIVLQLMSVVMEIREALFAVVPTVFLET